MLDEIFPITGSVSAKAVSSDRSRAHRRRHRLGIWNVSVPEPGRSTHTHDVTPFLRLIGRFRGVLTGITVYPPTGPPPPKEAHAQQLDCPFLGRCRGCWVESWQSDENAPPSLKEGA